MIELGEWSVVVKLPAETSDDQAALTCEAVSLDLRAWAAEASKRLERALGIKVEVLARGLEGI